MSVKKLWRMTLDVRGSHNSHTRIVTFGKCLVSSYLKKKMTVFFHLALMPLILIKFLYCILYLFFFQLKPQEAEFLAVNTNAALSTFEKVSENIGKVDLSSHFYKTYCSVQAESW